MRKSLVLLALAATAPAVALHAQSNLSPTDAGGNWQVKCTVIANDAPPTGPCNGVYSTATRVTASPAGWSPVPIAGPNGNAYYISEEADASIWGDSPNETPHYEYTFKTTFDGFAGTAAGVLDLSVLWLDNYWVGWSLNGSAFSALGITPPPAAPNGSNWTIPFSLSLTGLTFAAGTNTIEFRIQGNGRTDGFLAQGTYDLPGAGTQSVVPEPATMTLLASGLVAMAGAKRRRRKA